MPGDCNTSTCPDAPHLIAMVLGEHQPCVCVVLLVVSCLGGNALRNGASSLGFGGNAVPPTWRAEADLAMQLPGVLGPGNE